MRRRTLLRGVAAGAALAGAGAGAVGASDAPPERHIVGVDGTAAAKKARDAADSVRHDLSFGGNRGAIAGQFSEQALQALERRPDVRYVEPDGQMQALGETTPWGVDRVDADKAIADGYDGDGADVAILDSGIDSDHPDLQANLGTGKAFTSCDDSCHSNDCLEPWDDDNDHGTHCAGIAAAVNDSSDVIGNAPEATLHAVKVLACDGYGYWSDIAAGLEYVADNGWDVASMSLGGDTGSSTLRDGCQYAANNGVLVVAAAGNSGPCSDCVMYPAKYSSVVAVSSTNEYDSLSSFSSTGPEVEIAAPGSSILSTIPGGTAYFSGTSMATPHVAGVGGTLAANGYSGSDARDRLGTTAEDIGLGTNESGNGLLDAEAAIGSGGGDSLPAEVNTVQFDMQDRGDWQSASFQGSYTDPVVIMRTPSYVGSQPVHLRLRNVTSSGFEYRMEEWNYMDNYHVTETVSYLVVERGTHTLSDGTTIEADSVSTDTGWTSASLSGSFDGGPVVLPSVQTYNGPHAVITRQKNVSGSGFKVRLQEEEAEGPHTTEEVGYVALGTGTGTVGGGDFEVGVESGVTDNWTSVNFATTFDAAPQLLAAQQTTNGWNPANVRHRNLDGSGTEFQVDEEQSSDDEVNHVKEDVGYVLFDDDTSTL